MRVIPAERGRVSIQLQFSSGGPAFHPAQQAEGGAEQPGAGFKYWTHRLSVAPAVTGAPESDRRYPCQSFPNGK